MPEPECATTRRAFRWPGEAREIVRAIFLKGEARRSRQGDLKLLIRRLVQVSGNPRDACWRFARQAGIGQNSRTGHGQEESSRNYWT